ncbi:hypothetical protein PIROE2DRAFT_60292 [Piromyces sp. E2]|nr:hypothetical protein PIROE2DRAFT_60292 [Piromyces sp. E2]|eukprot:OUM64985.1 hypothetical protein PIROE2DRAFT_60292 [Piromyces sp. E2]
MTLSNITLFKSLNSNKLECGQCDLNSLRIFASPDRYILRPVVENYKYNITFKFKEIEIVIGECGENQIKMVDKDGSWYCENPICKDSCPVGTSAKCLPFLSNINKNDRTKNICQCAQGWNGENCDERIYVDYR